MRSHRLIAVFALGALLCACSSSGTQPPAAAAPAAPAAPAAAAAPVAEAPAEETAKVDRTVCKSVAPTGSRIARKTCRTQSQWDEMARSGREAAEMVKRRGAQSVLPSN
jgi:hypothetical protein